MSPDRAHQKLMIDRLEKAFDVEVQYPLVAPASLPSHGEGFFRRLSRSVSIRVRVETRFEDRLQEIRYHHLRDAVSNGWYSQRAHLSIGFWYFHSTYWWRKVAARCQPIPQLVEVP